MTSTLRTFLFVLILLPLIITAFVYLQLQLAQDYGLTIDDEYSGIYNKINDTIKTNYDNSRDLTDTTDGETFDSDAGESAFEISLFKAVKFPLINLSIITQIITETANILGIPDWIWYAIISLIMTLLVVLILSVGFRTTV